MLDRLRLRLIITLATAVGIGVPVSAADDHGHGPVAAAAAAHGAADVKAAAKADPVAAAAGHDAAPSVPANEAIKMLVDGNDRFVAGTPARPHQAASRLCETFTGGQHPYAAVLACADSRVPVELLFDAGIGDLFVTRVAGNVADVDEVGTIEYAVEHLGINAIVVIGHSKCGAVTAVVDGAHVTPNIEKLVDNIVPAADEARRATPAVTGQKLVARAIRANVRHATAELTSRSPLLKKAVESGKLKIVGGVYDLHSGQVDWLEQSDAPAPTAVTAPAHAKPDAHAAPAHKGGHSQAEDHADHDEHAAATPVKPAAKSDNFWALGGCMVGAGALSFGTMRVMKGRGTVAPEATKSASSEGAAG